MEVFGVDDYGYVREDLSHLGAVQTVNFDDLARGGFGYQQEGRGKNWQKPASISKERYVGIERRLRPHKTRDEGERRIGCPYRPSVTTRNLLIRNSSAR
jgi:hypothetical protein